MKNRVSPIEEVLASYYGHPLQETIDIDAVKNSDIVAKKRIVYQLLAKDLKLRWALGYEDKDISPNEYLIPYIKLNGIQKEVKNFVMFDIADKDVSYNNEVIKHQILNVVILIHEDEINSSYTLLDNDTDLELTAPQIRAELEKHELSDEDREALVSEIVDKVATIPVADYEIPRTDLVDYVIKDMFAWTNVMGMQLKLVEDYHDIIDSKYYARMLRFRIEAPNSMSQGGVNRYDRLKV